MSQHPKVAVVILNWNGKNYLEKFLPSVLTTDYDNLEIFVIDNGSTDESVAFLRDKFSSIRVISFEKNYGFTKGYNAALKLIQADYFALLNSDVEVKKDWIQEMVNLLETNELLAACQPKILSYTNRNFFEYAGAAGGWIDRFGYPFARGRIFDICEEDRGQYDNPDYIFWASGAALFVRAEVFRQVKGFDEYFFAHQEEIDLCWRIQYLGYKLISCPQAVVYHLGGGTLPRGNTRKTYLNFRNNLIMLAKNLPWSEKWWKIPFRILLDNVSAFKGLFKGDGGYFIAIERAHLAFIKWILFKQRESRFPDRRNKKFHGVYPHNLAWEHFVKKKKYFTEIVEKA